MLKIKAELTLNLLLRHPIRSGYRPILFFLPNNGTSGAIHLLDREKLFPGETAVVDIFPVTESQVDPTVGRIVKIGESPATIIGEIKIIEVSTFEAPRE